jgi:hypothetical protein
MQTSSVVNALICRLKYSKTENNLCFLLYLLVFFFPTDAVAVGLTGVNVLCKFAE